MVSRAEGMIKVRDHILTKFFEAAIGEDAAKVFKAAVDEADAQLEMAMKGKGDG